MTRLSLASLVWCWCWAARWRTRRPTRSGRRRTWTQIGQAMATVGPGDVVQVDGNATYSAVRWTKSGSAAQPIRLVGMPVAGMRPLIQGGTNTVEIEADHVVMEGFDISGGSSRCFFHHGDDVTLRDSVVHDCPAHGILGADTDSGSLLVEYVEVHHCGSGTQNHQIYMATDEVAHPGARVPHAVLLRSRRQRRQQRQVARRAQRDLLQLDRGRAVPRARADRPRPGRRAGGWPRAAREDSDVVGNVLRKTATSFVVAHRRRRHGLVEAGATASSTTRSSRPRARAPCSGCSTSSRASRCTTT